MITFCFKNLNIQKFTVIRNVGGKKSVRFNIAVRPSKSPFGIFVEKDVIAPGMSSKITVEYRCSNRNTCDKPPEELLVLITENGTRTFVKLRAFQDLPILGGIKHVFFSENFSTYPLHDCCAVDKI